MTSRIETAFFVDQKGDFPEDADRIYMGHEFCERKLPTVASLRRWISVSEERRKPLSLVTPYVTEDGLERIDHLLEELVCSGQSGGEVVVNDWGVLHRLRSRYSGALRPVLGRLLTKQRRDPRIPSLFDEGRSIVVRNEEGTTVIRVPRDVPGAMANHVRGSPASGALLQSFLVSQGVVRLEFDCLAWEMDLPRNPAIGVSLYAPYAYVATSRFCGKLTLSYGPCLRDCDRVYYTIEGEPFLVRGNTVFTETPLPTFEKLKEMGVDRVVRQPSIPS